MTTIPKPKKQTWWDDPLPGAIGSQKHHPEDEVERQRIWIDGMPAQLVWMPRIVVDNIEGYIGGLHVSPMIYIHHDHRESCRCDEATGAYFGEGSVVRLRDDPRLDKEHGPWEPFP